MTFVGLLGRVISLSQDL